MNMCSRALAFARLRLAVIIKNHWHSEHVVRTTAKWAMWRKRSSLCYTLQDHCMRVAVGHWKRMNVNYVGRTFWRPPSPFGVVAVAALQSRPAQHHRSRSNVYRLNADKRCTSLMLVCCVVILQHIISLICQMIQNKHIRLIRTPQLTKHGEKPYIWLLNWLLQMP